MNKFFVMFLILIACLSLSAVKQDVDDAWQVADNFVNSHLSGHNLVNQVHFRSDNNEDIFLFETDNNGFIAVPGDDIFPPVIAYSKRNSIAETGNAFITLIERDLENRRRYYQINPDSAVPNQTAWRNAKQQSRRDRDFQQWPPEDSTPTDGWVETTWNQSGVYNRFCPLDNSGERSVVGCTATAMAMIMDFHNWIGDPTFNNSDDYYSWSQGMYIDNDHNERDFPTFSELNVYLDDLVDHYANDISLTNDDKSALSFAAGVSVEMDYSSTGSGAWGVVWPLLNKFGYDSATEIDGYAGNFYDIMIDNMKHMRPGEMAIYSETSGHAIIVDGYNTDDFYHLNYGWGTSNNTCWYSLPNGMPSGYTVISSCILNIEGGDIPVEVNGNIYASGTSIEGAEINLYGEPYSYRALVDESGSFELPAVLEGYYTLEARLDDRIYYYYEENVLINEANTNLNITLGNFDAVTGNVSAPVSTETSTIRLYEDGELAYQGFADENGDFSIADVLPGNYRATASLEGLYYQENDIEITLENQTASFELQPYPSGLAQSFGTSSESIWSLVPGFTLGCAIKLTGDELLESGEDIIAGVRFKAPFNDDTGWLKGQIWENDMLIAEKDITDFSEGDWISCDPGNYIMINPDNEYYVGYMAFSESGQFAWHDNTPRVSGKGAFVNHSGWTELQPGNFDFNFSIEALFGSHEFGLINGSVQVTTSLRDYSEIVIKAGTFVTHPEDDGSFELPVKYGEYDVQAFFAGGESNIISGIIVSETESVVEAGDLLLTNTENSDDDLPAVTQFIKCYPNPFSRSTLTRKSQLTILFNTGETNRSQNIETIEIFNLRGQKVRSLSTSKRDESGTYSVSWDGKDANGRTMPSGIYFSRVKARDIKATKFLMLK